MAHTALIPSTPLGLAQSSETLIRSNLSDTYKGLESQGRGLLDVMARFLSCLHDGLDGSVAAICASTGLSANRVRESLRGLRGMTVATLCILLAARPSVVVPGIEILLAWVKGKGATMTLADTLADLAEASAAVSVCFLRGDYAVSRYLDRIDRDVVNLRALVAAQ